MRPERRRSYTRARLLDPAPLYIVSKCSITIKYGAFVSRDAKARTSRTAMPPQSDLPAGYFQRPNVTKMHLRFTVGPGPYRGIDADSITPLQSLEQSSSVAAVGHTLGYCYGYTRAHIDQLNAMFREPVLMAKRGEPEALR